MLPGASMHWPTLKHLRKMEKFACTKMVQCRKERRTACRRRPAKRRWGCDSAAARRDLGQSRGFVDEWSGGGSESHFACTWFRLHHGGRLRKDSRRRDSTCGSNHPHHRPSPCLGQTAGVHLSRQET